MEDDLAKAIVDRILRDNHLLNSKLVHVLPCGGYTNVIDLAHDVVRFNLLGRKASVSIVLDGDVKEKANKYINKKKITNNVPLNYLSIESLEKFLKTNLFDNVNHKLFRELNDYIFHNKSLDDIISDYKLQNNDDKDGKKLYSAIDKELIELREDRSTLIEFIIKYLFDTNSDSLSKISDFLKKQMQ